MLNLLWKVPHEVTHRLCKSVFQRTSQKRTSQKPYVSRGVTVRSSFFGFLVFFLQVRHFSGLTEAAMAWTCIRTARSEDIQRNMTRGGGLSCESNWRIYFLCVGRLQDTSVLLAEGRPDNLDTTSTTNCYSTSELFKDIHPHSFTHTLLLLN